MNTLPRTRPESESAGIEPTVSTPRAPANEQHRPGSPEQLLAAFRKSGVAVGEKAAQARSQDWYVSSGNDWVRALR